MNLDDRDTIGEGMDTDGCGHPACGCAAGPSGFCSPACEAQADTGDDDERAECACGHADCGDAGVLSETGS
jgi:hypothetical protein